MRKQFLFSVFIACLFGSLTWAAHITSESSYHQIKKYIVDNEIYNLFLLLAIVINLVETFIHFLTVLKFVGIKTYVPHGSRDDQSLSSFLTGNMIDVIGWELMFICYIPQPIEYKISMFWYPALLASMHIVSGFISVIFYPMFKRYFIDLDSDKQITISSEKHWFRFRTTFIFLDAITRLYMVIYLVSNC